MSRSVLLFVALSTAGMAADHADREERFFNNRVAPILVKRCLPCHNQELSNGGISFLDRESLLRGGRRGPAIVPGKPEQSVLIESLRHDGEFQMPPGPKLPTREIAVLTDWIRRGAQWSAKLAPPARRQTTPR